MGSLNFVIRSWKSPGKVMEFCHDNFVATLWTLRDYPHEPEGGWGFFLWSHVIFLFRIRNKCKLSSPKIAQWDFSYFLDHHSKVYNSTVSRVPVILFFNQTQCWGLYSIISERTPRSLCDSTIKALVFYNIWLFSMCWAKMGILEFVKLDIWPVLIV